MMSELEVYLYDSGIIIDKDSVRPKIMEILAEFYPKLIFIKDSGSIIVKGEQYYFYEFLVKLSNYYIIKAC